MRARVWLVVPLLLVAACRNAEVSQPQLRRPLETLPDGARLLLLTSDLQNTWDRLEAHDVLGVLQRFTPTAELFEHSEVSRLRARLRALEARSGTKIEKDLLLNALGGRAGLALYPGARRSGEAEILLVAELRDPERFRSSLAALRGAAADSVSLRVVEDTLDGKPVLRFEGEHDRGVVVLQQEQLLVASTSDDLVRRELAVQSGTDSESAMREPGFAAALSALGLHNIMLLTSGSGERGPGRDRDEPRGGETWTAQGFTWDQQGLHFEHLVHVASSASLAPTSAAHREEILRAIPDGVTAACYTEGLDAAGLRDLVPRGWPRSRSDRDGAFWLPPREGGVRAARFEAARDAESGVELPILPDLQHALEAWGGGEMGVALLGVQATPLAPYPSLALIVRARDPNLARDNLRDLERSLAKLPVGPTSGGFADVSYGGRTYRSLAQPLFDIVAPSYLVDGDLVILATTRDCMQQIIDTRRTGRRTVLSDASFRRFKEFVPADARAVIYADQRRLHRDAERLGRSAKLWGPSVEQGVQRVESAAALLEHFPSGAAYLVRTPDLVTLRGWMLEND